MNISNKFFKHYKGDIYYVLHISKNTETLEEYVNYIDLKKLRFWSRPKIMWFENVNDKPRFKLFNPSALMRQNVREWLLTEYLKE